MCSDDSFTGYFKNDSKVGLFKENTHTQWHSSSLISVHKFTYLVNTEHLPCGRHALGSEPGSPSPCLKEACSLGLSHYQGSEAKGMPSSDKVAGSQTSEGRLCKVQLWSLQNRNWNTGHTHLQVIEGKQAKIGEATVHNASYHREGTGERASGCPSVHRKQMCSYLGLSRGLKGD